MSPAEDVPAMSEGSFFHMLGKNRLELRYRLIDENHLVFSRTAETVSKDAFQKVLGLTETLTPAQINKKIRASTGAHFCCPNNLLPVYFYLNVCIL